MRGRRVFGWPRRFRLPVRYRRAGSFLGLAALLVIAPGLDVASLVWRKSEGCRVWMVVDGDTVQSWCGIEGPRTLRLLGYDTPEMKGRCLSETARAFAATYRLRWELWTARDSVVTLSGRRDRYGRSLARLRLDGRDVGSVLMRAGLARAYSGGKRFGWCGGTA